MNKYIVIFVCCFAILTACTRKVQKASYSLNEPKGVER